MKRWSTGLGIVAVCLLTYVAAYWVLIKNRMLYRGPVSRLLDRELFFRTEKDRDPFAYSTTIETIEQLMEPASWADREFVLLPRYRRSMAGKWVSEDGKHWLELDRDGTCQYHLGGRDGHGKLQFTIFYGGVVQNGDFIETTHTLGPIHLSPTLLPNQIEVHFSTSIDEGVSGDTLLMRRNP